MYTRVAAYKRQKAKYLYTAPTHVHLFQRPCHIYIPKRTVMYLGMKQNGFGVFADSMHMMSSKQNCLAHDSLQFETEDDDHANICCVLFSSYVLCVNLRSFINKKKQKTKNPFTSHHRSLIENTLRVHISYTT